MTARILAHRHRLVTDENSRWWTLGAMCFALFMIMLDNTVVNVALPSIQRDLHASLSALEWTVNAYTLTFAVLMVTGGRLGDIFGRRRMFLFGVAVFGVSSAAIGFAPTDTDAGRVPGRPGHRRRVHDARDAVDHHPGVPARAARDGDRHVGRRQRAGARDRPGARRLSRPSTSAGARSSSSTRRSPSIAVAVTLFAARESRDETVDTHASTSPASPRSRSA